MLLVRTICLTSQADSTVMHLVTDRPCPTFHGSRMLYYILSTYRYRPNEIGVVPANSNACQMQPRRRRGVKAPDIRCMNKRNLMAG